MRVVGITGSAWVLVPAALVLAGWATWTRGWSVFALVVVGGVLVWVVNPGLKRVFARARPSVRDLAEPSSPFSFPAGHAVASATFATILVLLAWPTRWRRPVTAAAVAYVALVGLSRLVLGVHYPSDLVAGWALGLAAVVAVAACVLVRPGTSGPD